MKPYSLRTPEEAAFCQAARLLSDGFGVANLKSVAIVGVQHILGTNLRLFSLMIEEFDLQQENVFILGKCYSTNPDVLKKFRQQGFCIAEESETYNPEKEFGAYFSDIVRNVWRKWRENLLTRSFDTLVILDDGGHLLRAVTETWEECPVANNVFGVEQTSSGFRRNHRMKLHFPIINVARARVKLRKESRIIATSIATIVRKRTAMNRPKVLVIGAGPMGEAVSEMLGAWSVEIQVYDDVSEDSDFDRSELKRRLCDVDIIIGATGRRCLTLSEIEGLRPGCQLISVSSEDIEFPATELRRKGQRVGREYVAADIDYNGVVLVNGGFPVNFCRDVGLADPESMFITRVLMLGAIFQGLSSTEKLAAWIRLDRTVGERADLVYEVASRGCVSVPLVDSYRWLQEWEPIDDDEFLSRIKRLYPYNELLSNMVGAWDPNSRLRKLESSGHGAIFRLENPKVALINDGSMRGAPYEYLNFGHYEEDELLVALRVLGYFKTGSVLDVGAHIGWFGLNVSGKFPNLNVHAVEPMPRTFKVLIENIGLNGFNNIAAHQVGVGREQKTLPFYYSLPHSVLSSRVRLFSEDYSAVIIEVSVVTLDAFCREKAIETVEFIKCDVEGQEFDVIQGAESTLRVNQPVVLVELYEPWCSKFNYTSREVFDFLSQFGYEAFAVVEGGWITRITAVPKVQRAAFSRDYNIFFMHSRKHRQLIHELSVKCSADYE